LSGAASATATYATAAVVGVVLTPVIIRFAGTKVSVLICQATYLIYCIANFYPGKIMENAQNCLQSTCGFGGE